jgi:predicted nucleotidyltransferase
VFLERFLPRDFIETDAGLIFAVVDGTLENDRVLSFLRYAPGPEGPRKMATESANALLRREFPHHLHHSPRLDAHLHAVALDDIARHHRPPARVERLRERGARDAIEERLLYLLALLEGRGVPLARLGVTGSLLIGRQNPDSDIDLVVYGRDEFFKARSGVRDLIEASVLDDLEEKDWHAAYARRGCALDFDEFIRHERRKGNKGLVGGVKFDLTLVDTSAHPETETTVRWRKVGKTTLQAEVVDANHAYHQPARYRISHPTIDEIVSFTHTYVGQALTGEFVEASGWVECGEDGRKRLVIGSSREAPGEFLRVLWEGKS